MTCWVCGHRRADLRVPVIPSAVSYHVGDGTTYPQDWDRVEIDVHRIVCRRFIPWMTKFRV